MKRTMVIALGLWLAGCGGAAPQATGPAKAVQAPTKETAAARAIDRRTAACGGLDDAEEGEPAGNGEGGQKAAPKVEPQSARRPPVQAAPKQAAPKSGTTQTPEVRLGMLSGIGTAAPGGAGGAAARATGGLPLDIPAGKQVARVEITGSSAPGAQQLVERLSVKPGVVLDAAQVRADLGRLWALGLFKDMSALVETLPDGKLAVRYAVTERPWLGQRFVEGAQVVPAAEVLALAGFDAKGGRFESAQLHRARSAVAGRYREEGYRLAQVDTFARRVGEVMDVCLRVVEGPRVTIDRVTFTGQQVVSEAELRGMMNTEGGKMNAVGGIYSELRAEHDLLVINAHYYDRGMIQARVGPVAVKVSEDQRHVSLEIPVEEGPVFRIGRIAIVGSAKDRAYERVLQARRGHVFVRSQLLQDIGRVQEAMQKEGRTVDVEPETLVDPKKQTVDFLMRIVDRKP
ncbi:POTRA domain-containing protein [Chondromyces apiculatus]|uniref:Surface antigen (D15) n=1 Tax=Chondromyces apiculatus DSM 436 TaxID=1192034 RepID=A0A017TFC8_9BACT|nr:POTRA domain-containing protein [Chondromyces apiculatus]EYF07949.1 surface antigen (D15) [Chondromyces apiculatus DSM 436]